VVSDGAARYLPHWELGGVSGTVVAIDVIRAFTTAACAFASGAREIWLAAEVDEALALAAGLPGAVVMGEERGLRPDGFHLSNSPVAALEADLDDRVVVQRTSAGTRGALAAVDAGRLFVAGLVNASATAAAVAATGSGAPAYVLTGWFQDDVHRGDDDRATAELIERVRTGEPARAAETAAHVAGTREAIRTLALGDGHVHPDDIAVATDVDRFDFAMEAERVEGRLRVRPTRA
jgi:2-phosphosulfolactate phosphatase